jgi:hypothetical protein
MKKTILFTMILLLVTPLQKTQHANAVAIAVVIREAIKKVVKAVDLMVQRIQNKTIGLQNAQKVLENALSKLKLSEIADWTDRHRQLYTDYYNELWKVKNTISSFQRIAQIMDKQKRLVAQYKYAWNLVRHDKHFTEAEIDHIYRVYSGILQQSINNLEEMVVVVNSFSTQMADAKRLVIIAHVGHKIDKNYNDLRAFTEQNKQLSINRAKDAQEIETIQRLYGLPLE